MNQRIAKLRKGIAEEVWTSKEKVRQQTRIMEPSIYDREEWTWEIRLLESKQQPEKLPPQVSPIAYSERSAVPADDGEEGESIGNRSDVSSSDGELDDFVVEDSPVMAAEKEIELNLADCEDDDGASDVSMAKGVPKLPTARKLIFKRPSIRSSKDSAQEDEMMGDAGDDSFVSRSRGSNAKTPVKKVSNLPKLPFSSPNGTADQNDVTIISSDDSQEVVNLVTPRKEPTMKITSQNSPIDLVSDSDESQMPDRKYLPPLEDTVSIARYNRQAWVSLGDRERLLISVLHAMQVKTRNSIFALISDIESQLWANMVQVMTVLRNSGSSDSVKGMDVDTFEVSAIF